MEAAIYRYLVGVEVHTHRPAPEHADQPVAFSSGKGRSIVPPLSTRINPWQYDRAMYKRRNEIERLFRCLKGFRRIFSRFEKLDVPIFLGFISLALIFDALVV